MRFRTIRQLHIAMALLMALLILFTGCGGKEEAVKVAANDLTAGLRAQKVEERSVNADFKTAQYRYALSLMQAAAKVQEKETFMLSPLSLELALAMTANAAEGETLSQLLALFGTSDLQELNGMLHSYVESLGKECSVADSIWIRDGAADPDKAFFFFIVNYYDAEIYKAAFDQTTVTDVNAWVRAKTNGMIDAILQDIAPEDLVYLLNAVCFEAKWETHYQSGDIMPGTFYSRNGAEQRVDFMFSAEYGFFSDDHAQGFVKDYEDGHFQFAAIRPNDGVDVFDYLAELKAEDLRMMVRTAKNEKVLAKIPRFKTESDIDMAKVL